MNQVYIGLPVKDLNVAISFYKGLGFEQDMRFKGEMMAQFKVSETIYLTLFPGNELTNNIPLEGLQAETFKNVAVALSLNSREEVTDLVSKAVDAGGKAFITASDQPFMFMYGFADLDGHVWTVFSMNM